METVKYVKFYNDSALYEVMAIDPNFEGNGTAYMVNVCDDIIEPCSESLIEQVYEQSSDGRDNCHKWALVEVRSLYGRNETLQSKICWEVL